MKTTSDIIAPEINRETVSTYAKGIVIVVGSACLLFGLVTLPAAAFSWGYLVLILFGTLLAPRMTISLPRSRFAISFSDAVIFLTFLIYGGSAAIVVAAIEMLASCLYLRSNGFRFGRFMIPVNVSINAVYTTGTLLVWLSLIHFAGLSLDISQTQHLISALGILALSQFFISSLLAAVFQALKDGGGLWQTWKRDCFSVSMSQIVGAGLAGLVYKLINFGDVLTGVIAFGALLIAYLNYRKSIEEVNEAIASVEEAERQKSETERIRRLEAERYASELSDSLEKEARANDALRKSEKDLQYAALYDSLTGLVNRKYLGDILQELITAYKENPATNFQVLFVDIKSFKNINDSLGHTIGDKVLTIAAKRFIRAVNSQDTVARIGGDEFAIILKNVDSARKAQKVARRIHQNISQTFSLNGNRISVDVNIGIAPCDAEYDRPEDILRDADIAMHYAKEKNDSIAVFTKELRATFLERARFEMDLRHAIDRDELLLHYQPIISLTDSRLIGFEALLRWNHSELGMIPPSRFIPVAERSGFIQPLTVWILRKAAEELVQWQKISPEYADLNVSINISGRHLSGDALIEDVEHALDFSGLRPSSLKLEITESSAMENAEETIRILNRLKQIGVSLSIDDFGTGYSSLSYLHRLPFDTLKIDRSFVNTVGSGGENSEILQTVISLAKNLKMRVVAEGIETESQFFVLRNLGCDYGQGYLFAKPVNAAATESLLYQHPTWTPFFIEDIKSGSKGIEANESLPVF